VKSWPAVSAGLGRVRTVDDREVHARLVATKVGLPLEHVTVWAGRDSSS
jgi:hypothetical protein